MTKYLFLEYPKCSTCQKARQWLEQHQIEFTARHIVENAPSAEELKTWQKRSGLPFKRFVNTSGLLYKSMNLKEKLPTLSEDERFAQLAANGMLVKRPLLLTDGNVLVSFKETEWAEKLL